jgi:ankyrin repeat protein
MLLIKIEGNKEMGHAFFMGRTEMLFYKTACCFAACGSFMSLCGMQDSAKVVLTKPQRGAVLNIEQWLRDLERALAARNASVAVALLYELDGVVNPPDIALIHDRKVSSLLIIAARHSQVAFAKAVLDRIPSSDRKYYVNLRDTDGLTAFDYAVHRRCMRIINLLQLYVDQPACDSAMKILKSEIAPVLHRSKNGAVMCLGAFSATDPSDDEDDRIIGLPTNYAPCVESIEDAEDKTDISVAK